MINRKIRIQTDSGAQYLELAIAFDHDDPDEISEMTIRTQFDGKEIIAAGTDYPFADAYADLQNKLPEGVMLTGCVACRHGNMCPVGDLPDEVFCTKDVAITCRSDLYFYTEDEEERKRRLRHYTDFCDAFQPQKDDAFTYNDYRFYLKKD